MAHGNKKKNDQIANSSGKTGYSGRQSWPVRLFFPLFSSRLYSTSVICYIGFASVSQNRLSWHHTNATGLLRPSQCPGTEKSTTLLNTLLCRKKAAKKRAFESILNATFEQADTISLLDERPQAAVDATGLESHHTSRYYVCRKDSKRFLSYRWPKITAVCDTKTHLFFACIVTNGPSNDSPEFAPAVIQASRFVKFDSLVADAAYDGEHNHRLCREGLGIGETMIPLNRRCSRKWPKSKYRRQMKEHFVKEHYNQRWQIESAFSRNKRLLGSALRSRTDQSRERECFLRILTHNLMIIRRAA
jgi:transposase